MSPAGERGTSAFSRFVQQSQLITQANADRVERCRHVIDVAKRGEAELWTSAFTLAEVWKKKCDTAPVGIQEEQDRTFEDFIESEFIKKINVDVDVGNLARRLLRRHPGLGKPQDAIHVASCLLANLDELHTFDGSDLLKFNGVLPRRDKARLRICLPPLPPEPEMFPNDDE
jgi:predicted nucleic acid-binding protein